jgi:hypothetical protein
MNCEDDKDHKEIPTIKSKVSRKKGPIWDFFQRAEEDPSSVHCLTCGKTLSLGRKGTSLKNLTSSAMKTHLKRHPEEAGQFMARDLLFAKPAIRQSTEKKLISDEAKQLKILLKYYEEDEAAPTTLLCQVREGQLRLIYY